MWSFLNAQSFGFYYLLPMCFHWRRRIRRRHTLSIPLGDIQFVHSVVISIIHMGPKYTHAQTGPTHMR